MKIDFFCTDCRQILKYQIAWKSVHLRPSCSMRTDGRTETVTKLIVAFRSFVKSPEMSGFCKGLHGERTESHGLCLQTASFITKWKHWGCYVLYPDVFLMFPTVHSFWHLSQIYLSFSRNGADVKALKDKPFFFYKQWKQHDDSKKQWSRTAICLYAKSQNCEERLLTSSCLSAWHTLDPTLQIFIKFYTLLFFECMSRQIMEAEGVWEQNMVLRRIFGPRRDEVTGEWRRLHNEELNDLY